jgi:predicted transcriptional regulator
LTTRCLRVKFHEFIEESAMTVELPAALEAQLQSLARETNRDPQLLAIDAVTAFIEDENAYLQAVRRGLDDAELGNVVSHEEAMRQIRAAVQQFREPRP